MKPPSLRVQGEDYIFEWSDAPISVTVRDISVGRDGPRAEVWAVHTVAGHLHAGMLNLLSTSSKQTFIKALLGRDDGTNWADAVEQFCLAAVEHYREGDELTLLEPRRRPESGRYAIQPLAPLGQPTLWYGDGKVLKSYLLLACCRAMVAGDTVAGMPVSAELFPAFLDWEWDDTEHSDRLLRLGGDVTFPYIRCSLPLVEQAKSLKRKLDKADVNFIAIDSLGLACGGDPSDPKIVLPFFAGIRYLGRTAVVIHHMSKDAMRRRSSDPYGSPYIRNSARSGWHFSRVAEVGEESATVAIQHKWTNVGRLEMPHGVRFDFDEDEYSTSVSRTDARKIMAKTGELKLIERISMYLSQVGKSNIKSISEELDAKEDQVRARLNDLRGYGKAAKAGEDWYLLDTEHVV